MFDIKNVKNKAQEQIFELSGKHQQKVFDLSDQLFKFAVKAAPKKVKSYFNSHLFEDDLDHLLRILNINNNLQDLAKFDAIIDKKQRVVLKTKHMRDQMGVFITALAGIGSEASVYVSGTHGALTGFVVGTALGLFIIVMVAGSIVIKRITEASDIIDLDVADLV